MTATLADYEGKLKWIIDNPNSLDIDMAVTDAAILGKRSEDQVRDDLADRWPVTASNLQWQCAWP